MEYYIIDENNQQIGPLSIEQLKGYRIKQNTKVWKQGMADWVNAETLKELNNLFVTPPPMPSNIPPPIQKEQPPLRTETFHSQKYNQPVQPLKNNNFNSGIEIKTKFFWLQWILLLTKPTVVINNTKYKQSWGSHFYTLEPGEYKIEIYVPYLFMRKMGKNQTHIVIRQGNNRIIRFRTPLFVFLKGDIKVIN